MVPNSDLFLTSLALSCDRPIPRCRSNADRLVAAGGRSHFLSTMLPLLFGLSRYSPSLLVAILLLLLLRFRLFTSLSSFLPSSFAWPTSANFLSSSSEDFLVTCWTVAVEVEAFGEFAESMEEKRGRNWGEEGEGRDVCRRNLYGKAPFLLGCERIIVRNWTVRGNGII